AEIRLMMIRTEYLKSSSLRFSLYSLTSFLMPFSLVIRSLFCCTVFISFVGTYNLLDKLMSDYVILGKIDYPDIFNIFEYFDCLNEPRRSAGRQVYLGDVTCYDRLGSEAKPR